MKHKMTIAEFQKSKETPAIREWYHKFRDFYYTYADAVHQYQEQMITFDAFMEKLKTINQKWRQK